MDMNNRNDHLIETFHLLPNEIPARDRIWDLRFLELARTVASWSKDPSTQVGAAIVDEDRRIVSVGYNGFSKGVEDTNERLNNRDKKYPLVIHAEENAILFAKRDLFACTMYTWPLPSCASCAARSIQVGIARVVSIEPTPAQIARWGDSFHLAEEIYKEAGVEVTLYNRDNDRFKRY